MCQNSNLCKHVLHELFYINIFMNIDMRNPGRIISIGHGNNIHYCSHMCLSGLIGKVCDFES